MLLKEIDETYRLTRLVADEQLLDPDSLDDGFVTIFSKSIELARMLLNEETFATVCEAYLGFASGLGHGPIQSVAELEEQLWSGYHPLVILFRRLEYYGVKGLYHYTDGESPAESKALGKEIAIAERFHDGLPSNWLPPAESGGKGRLGEILLAAQARFALDSGQDLTVNHIIALSGVARRSVQNALSSQEETGLRANSEGMIPNAEARRWLVDRRNFQPTRRYEPKEEESTKPVSPGKPVAYAFIPKAEDGSEFRPETRRDGGYQIGAKGEEQYVPDYFDALAQLQTMTMARWRRPNANGSWGIVTAKAWIRVPLDELKRD